MAGERHAELSGTVVITGGGSGIGRAAALASGRLGASVAVCDMDAAAAHRVADEARVAGAADATAVQCDVRDEGSVFAAVLAAASMGPIRGLVTSAGVDRSGLAHEMPLDRWQTVIETNLTGTFLACKHGLAQMLSHGQGGSIVCISSPWGVVSAAGGTGAYSASKGGVNALVRSLALDYARHSVRVNALLPGATETKLMWANVPPEEVPAMRERIGGQLALGRLAQPQEIAEGIVWLLSERSSYVTGSQFVMDGGLLAKASIEG